jgi:hypothetical protein
MKLNIYLLINAILLISFKTMAQPCTDTEEYFRKRHKIDGMTYGHPYTIFDRHNGKSINQTLQNIRDKIISESNPQSVSRSLFKAYELLYQNATSAMPTDDGLRTVGSTATSYSQKAVWAKNNAFVFLVGLNASGQRLDSFRHNLYNYKRF